MRLEVRQTQWLRALFAYAELHADPSFEVRPELEAARTVPRVRWHCHRDLLQAHAALVSGLPRSRVREFRAAVAELVRAGASYERVETELGEFQALDAAHILSNCPFLWRAEHGSTYWSGDDPPGNLDEATQRRINVSLGGCRAHVLPPSGAAAPVCISISVHAPRTLLEADRAWVSPADLSFEARVQPLSGPDASGCFSTARSRLIEHLPLVRARAAWAVAVRLEERLRSSADAQAALDAALELVRALSVSSETRVPSWENGPAPRVIAIANVVRDTAISVLCCFECIQRCFFSERVPPSRDRYLFDSKNFCAVSPDGINKTLSISGSVYSVSLQVELQEEPLADTLHPGHDRAMRTSTVRVLAGRRRHLARKRSV